VTLRTATAILTALLLGCGSYASITPSRIDLGPLMSCRMRVPVDLNRAPPIEFREVSPDGRTRWNIYAYTEASLSTQSTAETFRTSCEVHSSGFSKQDVKLTESGDDQSCVTPVGQVRSDPEGGRLPTDSYFTAVVVRRGAVVVDLTETRYGPPTDREPANEVLSSIAQRLCDVSVKSP
jgi:hypothetical protein